MAIAVCSVKIIGRSHGKGQSMVAAAAYRAGVTLRDDSRGQTHDYTRKTGVVYSEILAPSGAPLWASNRQQLCNLIEHTERRKDSQLAREVMVTLPRELTADQNIALARAYAQTFVQQGMIADLSIHDSGDGNPHAHILLTLRSLAGNGFGKKCREWNSDEQLMAWRKRYQDITNHHLKLAGYDVQIDVRSYEAQGIDRIPGVHLGPYAHRLEQQGFYSELGARNREIAEQNRQLDEIAVETEEAYKQRDEIIREIAQEEATAAQVEKQEEEQEHSLSERGRRNFDMEQVYAEKTLEQAKQPTPESETSDPHPVQPPPESGPPSSEPELLRQRKLALEQEQRGKEDGSRGPTYAHVSRHNGGRSLAQQRRAAQQQEQQKAEDRKPQQTTQPLLQHHKRGDISQQRKIALGNKSKDPVSKVYKEQHHERGNDVQRKPHYDAERGRQYTKRHDKKI